MKLTKNFTLKELTKSYTAQRLGINNKPNTEQTRNLSYLAEKILQPCRDEFGRIDILSGFRCKLLNDAVGSSDTSFHRHGQASDIEAHDEDVSNFELLLWIHENLPYTELIAEHFGKEDGKAGWVHCAISRNTTHKLLKLKDKDHNYKVVTIEYLKDLYV